MFDASPSPDFLRRFIMAQNQNPMPYIGNTGINGGMPPASVPSPMSATPNMGDGMGTPPMQMGGYRPLSLGPGQPSMGGMRGIQERGNSGAMGGAVKRNMQKPNPMSSDRPGFWGKYNSIAQGIQPMLQDYLMRD